MQPTVIVYGGIQAHAMAIVLQKVQGIGDRYAVSYISDVAPAAPEGVLDACTVLLEQNSETPFPYAADLPLQCRHITFPLLDFELLWPLEQTNPYNEDGKFPYGNRFVVNAVRQGLSKEQILESYAEFRTSTAWRNLDKQFVAETARLMEKDAGCSVRMSSFILKNFRRTKLFCAPHHPSDTLLAELIRRTLRAAFPDDESVRYADVDETLKTLGARDMLGVLEVPVHPAVAEHFDLAWYAPGKTYNFYDDESLTHDQYFERMIESALRMQPKKNGATVSNRRKPSLIVYGNCQAEAVHAILQHHPRIAEGFRPLYLRSFDHPTEGFQELPESDVKTCAVLFEQYDAARPFPYRDKLAQGARTVKFPAMDLNVLWPFNRVNPYNRPEPPDFPFGRFAYGDSVIVECIERGMPAREILEYYLTQWEKYAPDLDRLLSLERARLLHRDKQCDIKLGHYIIENFAKQRLFWTVNHPTNTLVCQLIVDLMNAAFPDSDPVTTEEIDKVRNLYFQSDPLGAITVPVHPKVAEHFGLAWYDPKERYVSYTAKSCTYVGYFENMIKLSLAHRGAPQPA